MIFKVLNSYTVRQRVVILLFVIDVFAWLVAPFSKYYFSNMEIYSDIVCLLSLFFLGGGMTSKHNINISIKYLMACLAIIVIPVVVHGDMPFVSVMSKMVFVTCFISLKPQYKWAIYEVFMKTFTVILALGIIEWLLMFANINFFWASVDRAGSQFFNHGIFILVPTYSLEGYARFMSLCEEPGSMGTICFFLLATLDYHKNKKQFFVLLVAGLISFSLGFYVLIGLWALTKGRRLGMSNIALGVVAVVLMMTLFGAFFQDRIVERVTGRTFESIDNRTNDEVDAKLSEISKDYRLYFGMGNRKFYEWEAKVEGVSAGVKNFILQYGIVGFIILLFALSTLILNTRGNTKNTWILIFFVWVSFYKSHTWNNPPLMVPLLAVSLTAGTNGTRKKEKEKLDAQLVLK